MKELMGVARKINYGVGKVSSYLILPMIFVTAYETTSRYLFNTPTRWATDLSGWCQLIYIMMGGAYAFAEGYFVRTDIVYARLSLRKRALIDLTVGFVLFLLWSAILIWFGFNFFYKSLVFREVSPTGLWKGPVYPVKFFIPLGVSLLFVQWVCQVIQDVGTLFSKEGDRR